MSNTLVYNEVCPYFMFENIFWDYHLSRIGYDAFCIQFYLVSFLYWLFFTNFSTIFLKERKDDGKWKKYNKILGNFNFDEHDSLILLWLIKKYNIS